MSDLDLDTIKKIPKVELHRHVDGAVDPELLWHLAFEKGLDIDHKNTDELAEFLKFDKDTSMERFFDKFDLVLSVMQTRSNIETVFRRQMHDLDDENIIYAELRFAPQYHTRERLTVLSVIEAALSGIKQGKAETGGRVNANLIVSIARETSPRESMNLVRAALEFQDKGVVAIDLACDEANHPPEKHKDAFELTFNTELRRTVHAGEFGDQRLKNIETAVKELKADRLGHAIPLAHDESLMDICESRGIRVESCPGSNFICGNIDQLEDLRLDILEENNVVYSINSDDPIVFDKSLSETIFDTARTFEWDKSDVYRLMEDAAISSFLNPKDKQVLTGRLKR